MQSFCVSNENVRVQVIAMAGPTAERGREAEVAILLVSVGARRGLKGGEHSKAPLMKFC